MASSDPSSRVPAGLEHLSDRYSNFAVLGEGGHALVYKALDIVLDKWVAIKVLHARGVSQDQIVRFQQEAKVLCRLKHPGLITVLNFGTSPKGVPYLIMELTEGCSLDEMKLSVVECILLFIQICQAMEHAHRQSIVHRDLKPSNILVETTGLGLKVKILDFGVARVTQSGSRGENDFAGSPLYMSPEQVHSYETGPQSDVYSLGCIMFELLAGMPPYIGENSMDTMAMHCKNEIPLLENRSDGRCSPELSRIVASCMAKNTEDRYQSMTELQLDLERELANLNVESKSKFYASATPIKKTFALKVPLILAALVLLSALIPTVFLLNGDAKNPQAAGVSARAPIEMGPDIGFNSKKRTDGFPFVACVEGSENSWAPKAKESDEIFSTIDDDSLKLLKDQDPRDLNLVNTKVTGSGLAVLAHWPIHSVNLGFSAVSDQGLKSVCEIKSIEKLSLNGTEITDKGLNEIATLKNLEVLRLSGCPKITDKGVINILEHCKKLSALSLSYSHNLTGKLIPAITSNSSMRRVELQGIGLNDEHVKMLCTNKSLMKIRLADNHALTDKTMEILAAMPHLQTVCVSGCEKITSGALSDFRRVNRKCQLVSEHKHHKFEKVEAMFHGILEAEQSASQRQ
ncbi:MAG: protein kinase [Cyanobacteria bacterium]|nr:protein kinase [Cyanobacteriota bacterium]